jgi:hypothetical protein
LIGRRKWAVTTPSGVFQSEVVVHRLAEFLLAAWLLERKPSLRELAHRDLLGD